VYGTGLTKIVPRTVFHEVGVVSLTHGIESLIAAERPSGPTEAIAQRILRTLAPVQAYGGTCMVPNVVKEAKDIQAPESRSFISLTTQSMNTRSFALTWRFGGYAM
jgi:hypothetical protein